MQMKKREFRNLRQGNRTVAQYVDEFSKLSRFAPDDGHRCREAGEVYGRAERLDEHAVDGGNIQQLPGVGR